MSKKELAVKRFIWHTHAESKTSVEIQGRNSNCRNLKAGVDVKAMKEYCFTGLLLMPFSDCFLIQPRTTSLGVVPPTVG